MTTESEWEQMVEAQQEKDKARMTSLTREQLEAAYIMMLYALREIADSRYGTWPEARVHVEHCMNRASSALYDLGNKEFGGTRI